MTKLDLSMAFNPYHIPDDALNQFRRLCTVRVIDTAPRFGEWVRAWIETEELARKTDPLRRCERHLAAVPPLAEYADKELGETLRAVTLLSFNNYPESMARFVDRLVFAATEIAAERLENTDAKDVH